MNVLLVYAHPEPTSLNGSLKNFSVKHLEKAGHTVQVSDLYAMNWKSAFDGADNDNPKTDSRFDPYLDSKYAFEHGLQKTNVRRSAVRHTSRRVLGAAQRLLTDHGQQLGPGKRRHANAGAG